MAKQPKWLRSPVRIVKTQYGFRHSGEGIIIARDRSRIKNEERIYYYVMFDENDRQYLMREAHAMSTNVIRDRTRLKEEFSERFKRNLLKLAFTRDKTIVDIFLGEMEEYPEIKEYF